MYMVILQCLNQQEASGSFEDDQQEDQSFLSMTNKKCWSIRIFIIVSWDKLFIFWQL